MLEEDTVDDQIEGSPVTYIEQAGAICHRRTPKGQLQVLLVGSRRNGRWGIPKGHIEPGETTSVTAAREAFEEAGVNGRVEPAAFGSFRYRKESSTDSFLVRVHLLETHASTRSFPEKALRKKRWFSLTAATMEVAQSDLRKLLVEFQKRATSA